MKVILISGKAEAGKSLTAKLLKEYFEDRGKKAVIVPYGQRVKETAKLIFDWDGQKDEEGRRLLQWWGTEVVRKKINDFWVSEVFDLACVVGDFVDYFIVDDCRFKNEIEYWKEWDSIVPKLDDIYTIRVSRPGHENSLTPEQREHISECDLDEYDFDIYITAYTKSELIFELMDKVFHRIEYPINFVEEQK